MSDCAADNTRRGFIVLYALADGSFARNFYGVLPGAEEALWRNTLDVIIEKLHKDTPTYYVLRQDRGGRFCCAFREDGGLPIRQSVNLKKSE